MPLMAMTTVCLPEVTTDRQDGDATKKTSIVNIVPAADKGHTNWELVSGDRGGGDILRWISQQWQWGTTMTTTDTDRDEAVIKFIQPTSSTPGILGLAFIDSGFAVVLLHFLFCVFYRHPCPVPSTCRPCRAISPERPVSKRMLAGGTTAPLDSIFYHPRDHGLCGTFRLFCIASVSNFCWNPPTWNHRNGFIYNALICSWLQNSHLILVRSVYWLKSFI